MVTVGGILSGVQRKVTRQGNPWAAATLEDLEGAIEVLFFPATYQQCSLLLAEDAILLVKGRLDRREESPKLIAHGGDRAGPVGGRRRPFRRVDAGAAVRRARGGPAAARCCAPTRAWPRCTCGCATAARTTVVRLDDKLRVKPSPALLADLKQLLGPACVG